MDFALLMKEQLDIMDRLFEAAQAENRDFNEDEQEKYTAAEKEFKRLKAAKEKADDLKAMANAIPEPAAHVPASNADAKATGAGSNVSAGDSLSTKKPYDSLGNMLIDVVKTKNNDGEAMDRLKNASLNTETGADGGFLIQEDFVGSMLKKADAQSQLLPRATEIRVKGNTASIPGVDEESRADGSRFGGISVNWVREGSEGSYSQPKFRNLDIKLSKLMGLVSVTSEMLEDSTLLTSWVNAAFPAEMAFAMDQAFYDGDGNGKPLGILNSNALVTVAKETSQTADTIVYENIIKMWARMPASRMSRAVWFVTQQALEQFPLMNLSVGTGGAPVYLPAGGASVSPYSTILGRPIIPIEQATALGDLGDIVLADMSDYMAVLKGGLKTASSIHVDFIKDKTAFRFIRRINGAPYTRTKLQSRASSTFYTSPYITLAARA